MKKHFILGLMIVCYIIPVFAADELIRGEQRQLLKRMAPVVGEGRLLHFQRTDGSVLRVQKSFFVVLKQGVKLESLLKSYPVRLVKAYSQNTFLLSTNQPILPMINRLYQDQHTLDAYPNTYKKVSRR